MQDRVWSRAVRFAALSLTCWSPFIAFALLLAIPHADGQTSVNPPKLDARQSDLNVEGKQALDAIVPSHAGGALPSGTPPVPADMPPVSTIEVESYPPFIWPALGPITSRMGPEHPAGIDIGLGAEAPVVAAAGGRVITRSANEDYGIYLVLEHADGLRSLYAHLARTLVMPGQEVAQGDLIAEGGSTGKSDGKHLHLEIQDRGAMIDPLRVLPSPGKSLDRSNVDCGSTRIIADRGARVVLMLVDGVRETASDLTVAIESERADAPKVDVKVVNNTVVEIQTAPTFRESREDFHRLGMRFYSRYGEHAIDCEIVLRSRRVAPSYYIRATATPSVEDAVPAEPTFTPSPTPTPFVSVSVSIAQEPTTATPAGKGHSTPTAVTAMSTATPHVTPPVLATPLPARP